MSAFATSPRDRTKMKQDYRTPQDLRHAVEKRFGGITIDLAAADGDEIVPLVRHFTPEEDALKQNWLEAIHSGVAWLNPPFSSIAPFAELAEKWCGDARRDGRVGAVICMLVLASVDAVWWDSFVRGAAIVYALAPRVTFHGETQPYPKACAICVYDPRHAPTSATVELWRWKGGL